MPSIDASSRDHSIVEHILDYCGQIDASLAEIGYEQERFMGSRTYQNAIAMCILQIGELVKRFTPVFLQENRQIPWSLIAKTRDIYAHHYGGADVELVWTTAVEDIPGVAAFCREYLKKE